MGRSKIEYDGEVLIDLTNDTTTAETTLAGYIGHGADGEPFSGNVDLSIYATTAYVDGQIDTLESSISTLSQTVSTQGESITSLQNQVSSNDTDITNLQGTATTQGQSISALQNSVNTINSELPKKATTSYVDTELAKKQNKVTYSTTDLTAGTSTLATGEIYFVYE